MIDEAFNLSEYLKELECLVNIDSVSSEPHGAGEIADFMEAKYQSIGWRVKRRQFAPTIGPCLEMKNTDSEAYDVLLLAHMDTVFPLGTAAKRPFAIQGGRAFGPGVIDCKAGLLSGFYALSALQDAGKLAGKSVAVFLNSDHEGISSMYSRAHLESLAKKSKCTLVLEAARANGNLVNRRKGIGRYHIETRGVAAHAGIDHQKGRSAIREIARWILALEARTNYEKETTLNVGCVSGGVSISAVPDLARAALDIRFYDAAEARAIESLMETLAARPLVAGTSAKFTGSVTRPPMVPTEKTDRLCRGIDAIGKELGITFGWAASGGGSDGSFSAATGTPTVDGLGPVGGGAHSADEYLETDTVKPRLLLLARAIEYAAAARNF